MEENSFLDRLNTSNWDRNDGVIERRIRLERPCPEELENPDGIEDKALEDVKKFKTEDYRDVVTKLKDCSVSSDLTHIPPILESFEAAKSSVEDGHDMLTRRAKQIEYGKKTMDYNQGCIKSFKVIRIDGMLRLALECGAALFLKGFT